MAFAAAGTPSSSLQNGFYFPPFDALPQAEDLDPSYWAEQANGELARANVLQQHTSGARVTHGSIGREAHKLSELKVHNSAGQFRCIGT